MRTWLLVLAVAIMGCAPPAASSDPGGILLVGNKGENTLSLIALADGKEIARLPPGPMPHEIAAETGRDQIAEIDFTSGTVLRRLDAGKNGDGLGLAPSPSHH